MWNNNHISSQLTSAQVLKLGFKYYARKSILESRGPAAHCPVEGLFTGVWVAPHIPTVRGVRFLKGEVRQKKLLAQSFYGPKLREVSTGNFYRKAPKLVKNQVKGSKMDQIKTKQPI